MLVVENELGKGKNLLLILHLGMELVKGMDLDLVKVMDRDLVKVMDRESGRALGLELE